MRTLCVCLGACMVGEINGKMQGRFWAGVQKCHRKDRECLCYTELSIPDQSNRSLNCFTSQLVCATNVLSWFVPPYMGCLWQMDFRIQVLQRRIIKSVWKKVVPSKEGSTFQQWETLGWLAVLSSWKQF